MAKIRKVENYELRPFVELTLDKQEFLALCELIGNSCENSRKPYLRSPSSPRAIDRIFDELYDHRNLQ